MKKLRYLLFVVLACITMQSNACELGVLAHTEGITDQDGIARFKILGKTHEKSGTVKITAIPINIYEWITHYGDKDSDPRIGSITLNIV